MEHRVTFLPKGKKTSVKEGTTLLEAAMEIGLSLRHKCGGNATCGTCRVQIEQGHENLSPVNQREIELLGEERLAQKFRLACQSKIKGPVTAKIPHWLPISNTKLED
jgi:2Fe-2S ferredoxin